MEQRRVTAADVARSLGVSRATVGFVLNNTPGQTISEGTRRRVLAEAERLGYRPHRAAQALRRGSSKLILLVLPDWPIEFSLRRHIEEASLALDETGYSLVTYTRHAADRARPLWELLNPDVVVGLIPFDEAELASIRASGVPRVVPGSGQSAAWDEGSVITAGPMLQAEHLHELGHERVAFASSADPRLGRLAEARIRTARKAARALGLGKVDTRPVDYRDDTALRAVERWHKAGVTGVVAYNDDVAATVISAAVRAGISVPGQLAVVGHDDSPLAAMFLPSISSVRFDHVNLGRFLADMALAAAEDRPLPAIPVIDATLVRREST